MPLLKRRPATPAQQEASRRNGAKSRGPITIAGKANSARNHTIHGLFAKDARARDQAFISAPPPIAALTPEKINTFKPANRMKMLKNNPGNNPPETHQNPGNTRQNPRKPAKNPTKSELTRPCASTPTTLPPNVTNSIH
jgi:hypothetical protein